MKKVGAIFLTIFALTVSTIFTPVAQKVGAESYLDSISEGGPSNLAFITKTDKQLEYTYTENNEEYKVIEFYNEDYTQVTSDIFKKNKESNGYEKVDHLVTTVDVEAIEQANGADSTLQNLRIKDSTLISQTNLNSDVIGTNSASLDPGGGGSATWTFHSISSGNNKPTRFTVGAIAIIIAAVTKLPASVKVVTNLANLVFQTGVDVVYHKKWIFTSGARLRPDHKYVTYIYADRFYSKQIGSPITSYISYPY